MEFQVRSVTLASGITLPFVEHGDPSGTPVVLLHGITDSWRAFELLLPHLPNSLRALAITQRGHGEASHPEDGYAPADFARDVAEFLTALNIPGAIIVGHSMGSYVAQRFAIDYPERTLGLVLLGTCFDMRENAEVKMFWSDVVSGLTDPVPRAVALDFQTSTLAKPIPAGYLEMFVNESLKVPARVWRSAFRAMLDEDHSDDLRNVTAPTLIIRGDRDAFFGREDHAGVASAIAGARLITYAGAGHAMHWEEPQRVARDIAEFAEEVARRRVHKQAS